MDNTTLRSCITKTLQIAYPTHSIYENKQQSTITLPAFFIRYMEVKQEPIGQDSYVQKYKVEIQYQPEESLPEDELSMHLDLLGGQIVDLLFTIRDDDFFARALTIDYQVSDGVLTAVASYHIRKRIITNQDPLMANLIERQEVK